MVWIWNECVAQMAQTLANESSRRPWMLGLGGPWSQARPSPMRRYRPCRARPADRSLVAEDRSAEGLPDRTGPDNPLVRAGSVTAGTPASSAGTSGHNGNAEPPGQHALTASTGHAWRRATADSNPTSSASSSRAAALWAVIRLRPCSRIPLELSPTGAADQHLDLRLIRSNGPGTEGSGWWVELLSCGAACFRRSSTASSRAQWVP